MIALIQQMHIGKDYNRQSCIRMRSTDPFADLIVQRFKRAHPKLGFTDLPELDRSAFQ